MDTDREGWLGAIRNGMHLVACKTSFFLAEKKEEKKKKKKKNKGKQCRVVGCTVSYCVEAASVCC